jgi:hypothetical protein
MCPSYDPNLRLFFVTARETCATYFAFDQEFKVGVQYMAGPAACSPRLHCRSDDRRARRARRLA